MTEIRSARSHDAMTIQNIYDEVVPHDVAGLKYRVTDWPLYVTAPQALLLIAHVRGNPAGFILGYDLVNWGLIDVLAVTPEWRRAGVGTALVNAFEQHGRGRWVASELATDPEDEDLRRFLHDRGYTVAGTTDWRVHDLSGEVESRRGAP